MDAKKSSVPLTDSSFPSDNSAILNIGTSTRVRNAPFIGQIDQIVVADPVDGKALEVLTFDNGANMALVGNVGHVVSSAPVGDFPTVSVVQGHSVTMLLKYAEWAKEDIRLIVTSLPSSGTLSSEEEILAAGDTGPFVSYSLPESNEVTYTSNTDFSGQVHFTYVVTDGYMTSPEATILIDVSAVNSAPVLYDVQQVTTSEYMPVEIILRAAEDVDSNSVSYFFSSLPARGSLTTVDGTTIEAGASVPQNMRVIYSPAVCGANSLDFFGYVAVDDKNVYSEEAIVSINVVSDKSESIAASAAGLMITFDGIGSMITFTTSVAFSAMTTEFYFKTSSAVDTEMTLLYAVGQQPLRVSFSVTGGLAAHFGSVSTGSTVRVNDGSWHYLAVSIDSESLSLYLDASSVPLRAPVNYLSQHADLSFSSIIIGAASTQGMRKSQYSGSIDNIAVYDYARTSADIANNKNTLLSGNEYGLVNYYTNDGMSVTDSIVH